MQIELYIKYEATKLMYFLENTDAYNPVSVAKVCEHYGLYKE